MKIYPPPSPLNQPGPRDRQLSPREVVMGSCQGVLSDPGCHPSEVRDQPMLSRPFSCKCSFGKLSGGRWEVVKRPCPAEVVTHKAVRGFVSDRSCHFPYTVSFGKLSGPSASVTASGPSATVRNVHTQWEVATLGVATVGQL